MRNFYTACRHHGISRWVFCGILFVLVASLPAQVHADANVRQDSCVVVGPDQVRIYFTVINLYLPRGICSFNVIAKTEPQPPACVAVDCGAPAAWDCGLNGSGGAGFGAVDTAPPGSGCIEPGASLGGFYITIDPGFCCYKVRYADAAGDEFLQGYVCFTLCDDLPVEQRTWGAVKQLYRD